MPNPAEQLQPEDIFGMSDDELSNLNLQDYEQGEGQDPEQPNEPTEEDDQDPEQDPESDADEGSDEGTDPEEGDDPNGDADPEGNDPEQGEGTQDNPDEGGDAPDYKELYQSIVGKTFRANGRDITVETPEQAIQLMQFGMNYHEKMAVIKPVRRTAKMLENAGLLDEEKLGFLIDLHNRKPEAIARYLKDGEIDVHDIDLDLAESYKNTNKAPTDSEMSINDVVSDLATEESFGVMFNGILKTWDGDSQTLIANNPEILRILQDQNRSGDYDAIMNEVARERMFNPAAASLPIVKLYRDSEVKLREKKSLPSMQTQAKTNPVEKLATAAELIGKPPADTSKRKAAATPRKAPRAAKRELTPEEIFALSDEEFAKIASTTK